MKWFLWIVLLLALIGIELPLSIGMIWFGITHQQPSCFGIGLLFFFPIKDSVKALRLFPWRCL